jgi:hypothetical protein
MSKKILITDLNKDKFVDTLRNHNISIIEDIKGSKIYFSFDSNDNYKVLIRQKSINNNNIEMIDLSNQNLYGKVYNYLSSLDKRIAILCQNIWFCVELIDKENSFYDQQPKHGMVLTCIVKNDDEYINDISAINEYAELLDITPVPVLFDGKLNSKQIELIHYFLSTSKEDLELIFGETDNFASFFYKILSNDKSSFLNTGYNPELNKLIVRTSEHDMSFEILNPMSDTVNTSYIDFSMTYSIIVSEMLEFLYKNDYENIYVAGEDEENIYLNLMCELFVRFIEDKKNRIINFEFDVPPYIYLDSYKINRECLSSKLKVLVDSDPKIEFMFKTCYKIFRNPVKKTFGVIDEKLLRLLNIEINNLRSVVDKKLNFETIDILKKPGMLSFNDFVTVNTNKIINDYKTPDGKVVTNNTNVDDINNLAPNKDKK